MCRDLALVLGERTTRISVLTPQAGGPASFTASFRHHN
jgi:hypothetical protein